MLSYFNIRTEAHFRMGAFIEIEALFNNNIFEGGRLFERGRLLVLIGRRAPMKHGCFRGYHPKAKVIQSRVCGEQNK